MRARDIYEWRPPCDNRGGVAFSLKKASTKIQRPPRFSAGYAIKCPLWLALASRQRFNIT